MTIIKDNHQVKKEKSYIGTLSIILLLWSGIVFMITEGHQPIYLAVGMIIALIPPILRGKINLHLPGYYLFFLLSFLLSLAANFSLNQFSKWISFAGLFFITYALIPAHRSKYDFDLAVKKILKVFFIIWLLLIIYMITRYDMLSSLFGYVFNYRGAFRNSNSLGTYVSLAFVICTALFFGLIEKAPFRKILKGGTVYFALAGMVLNLLLIFASHSRSSFVSGAACIGIMLIVFIRNKIGSHGDFSQLIKIMPIIGVVMLFLYNATAIPTLLENAILSQFEMRSDDIFAGRTAAWVIVVQNWSLFGNPTIALPVSTHSSYIELLRYNGIFTLIAFIVMMITMMFKSFKFILVSDCKYKYVPFAAIFSFYSIAFVEGMNFKVHMILSFMLWGLVVRQYSLLEIDTQLTMKRVHIINRQHTQKSS